MKDHTQMCTLLTASCSSGNLLSACFLQFFLSFHLYNLCSCLESRYGQWSNKSQFALRLKKIIYITIRLFCCCFTDLETTNIPATHSRWETIRKLDLLHSIKWTKTLSFFYLQLLYRLYKIHKNKMDEHFSFTHTLLVCQKYLWRRMLFVPQNACC